MPRKVAATPVPPTQHGAGPSRVGRSFRATPLLVAAGLVVAVLVDYGQLCGKDATWFMADDDQYVFQNKNVNTGLTVNNIRWALTHFHSTNWHPLTWWSLQLDSDLYRNFNDDGR